MTYDPFGDEHEPTVDSVGYNEEQKSGSIKGTRLDKHCDDGRVQPDSSVGSPGGLSNIPAMQDESCDNHGGEKDIERKADQVVCSADTQHRSSATRDFVGIHDARRCICELADGVAMEFEVD